MCTGTAQRGARALTWEKQGVFESRSLHHIVGSSLTVFQKCLMKVITHVQAGIIRQALSSHVVRCCRGNE